MPRTALPPVFGSRHIGEPCHDSRKSPTDARTPAGALEEFLFWRNGATAPSLPIESNAPLVSYLRKNPGYHIVQHGCHHNPKEFNALGQKEAARRAERGTRALMQAGFPKPETFVAPHDKFSRASMEEIARRFRVISTGWFELGRVPLSWWPNYAMRKLRRAPHWKHGSTMLLSHPGCILSRNRPRQSIVNSIIDQLRAQRLLPSPCDPLVGILQKWRTRPNPSIIDPPRSRRLPRRSKRASKSLRVRRLMIRSPGARADFRFPAANLFRIFENTLAAQKGLHDTRLHSPPNVPDFVCAGKAISSRS